MRRLAFLLAGPFLLAACSAATSAPAGRGGGGSTAVGLDSAQSAGAPAAVPAPNGALAPKEGIPTVVVNADRNLILTAKIDMRSKDPWSTSDRAQLIATSLGGDVLNLSQTGSGENRSASLTMRVPSSRFSEAIRQLKELDGEVATSAVSAQDVTDQFVDLQARLAAKQSEEQRYLALLGRANTIDEILKIDASLSNVRLQIEQLTGQINSIKSRTEFSTISMSVSPIAIVPFQEPAKAWDPAKTVARALAALGAMLQVFADLAIWLVIFGWLPLIALAGVLFATRARRPTAPSAPTV